MKNDFHLERRIHEDLIVSGDLYISGLIDITQWLILDLKQFLKEEGRFFGIMPTYVKTIEENYKIFRIYIFMRTKITHIFIDRNFI